MAAAVAHPPVTHRNDHVFNSVFPRPNFTTPTPQATPNIGAVSSPMESFSNFDLQADTTSGAYLIRAWSTTTRYLSLPTVLDDKSDELDHEVVHDFSIVLQSALARADLLAWYNNQISTDYRKEVLPELKAWQQEIPLPKTTEVLYETIRLLRDIQRNYLGHLESLILRLPTHLREDASAFATGVREYLHSIIRCSLPRERLHNTLGAVMFLKLTLSLQSESRPEICLRGDQCHCTLDMDLHLHELHSVGLGNNIGERAFAVAVHIFLTGPAIERRCFQVDWNGHCSVVRKAQTWIKEYLCPVIERTFSALTGNVDFKLPESYIQQYVSIETANIGRLRTRSLFDYIKAWPASTGAILDIREYLQAGNHIDKTHVCQTFNDQLRKRLLHAGASTTDIMSIYINVVHAFKTLDGRGVLLEKVAAPIRSYLRGREDTVSIIATSFLADIDRYNNAADFETICPDIITEVANSRLEDMRDKKTFDWDDMNWVPDPIDAGPDYKSSKTEDVVTYVLGLFDQEDFINAVTGVLAQHLLHGTDPDYSKEYRLVELLKSRLEVAKLQAAEVMLKDVRDSVTLNKRINPHANYDANLLPAPTPREIQAAIPEEGISLSALWRIFDGRMKRAQFTAAVKLVANKRNDLFYAKRTRIPSDIGGGSASKGKQKEKGLPFKAQILSNFFWPQLRANEFDMPHVLEEYQTGFEERFNALGNQRKLQFRPALARVSMKLEFEDRTVEERDVPGWRASVLDCFTAEPMPEEETEYLCLTVDQLSRLLNMEADLVQDALNFWISKSILYQPTPGMYAVLERLDMATNTQQTLQPQESLSAVVSQDAQLRENAPMFQTFIANMLRNQGPKAIGGMMGITSLLKMVLPGFTYGDDEVAWLLGEMEGRGEVGRNGEVWSVVS